MDKIAESILKFLKLDGLISHVTGYVESRIELMKMEMREDIAKTVARAIVMVALLFAGFLCLLFFSVGLAHFINLYFDKPYAGYWSVAAIYLIAFLVLLLFRKSISSHFEHQLSQLIKRKEK